MLVLTGGGIELRFDRLDGIAASALLGTDWRLESLISGETVSSVIGEGFLRLEISGALAGNAGCRDVAGRYSLDGATVVVSGFTLAAADCPGEFTEQEDHVGAVLGDRFTATIDGDSLTVTTIDGDLALGYGQSP
jgi:heat shock protein HslJ